MSLISAIFWSLCFSLLGLVLCTLSSPSSRGRDLNPEGWNLDRLILTVLPSPTLSIILDIFCLCLPLSSTSSSSSSMSSSEASRASSSSLSSSPTSPGRPVGRASVSRSDGARGRTSDRSVSSGKWENWSWTPWQRPRLRQVRASSCREEHCIVILVLVLTGDSRLQVISVPANIR